VSTKYFFQEQISTGSLEDGLIHAATIIKLGQRHAFFSSDLASWEKNVLPQAAKIMVVDLGSKTFLNAGNTCAPNHGRSSDRHYVEAVLPDSTCSFVTVSSVPRSEARIFDYGVWKTGYGYSCFVRKIDYTDAEANVRANDLRMCLRDINKFGLPLRTCVYGS